MAYLLAFALVWFWTIDCLRYAYPAGLDPKYTGCWKLSPITTRAYSPAPQWGCSKIQYPSNLGRSSSVEFTNGNVYIANVYHVTHPLGNPQCCQQMRFRRPHTPPRHSRILHLRMRDVIGLFGICRERACGHPCTHACYKTIIKEAQCDYNETTDRHLIKTREGVHQ